MNELIQTFLTTFSLAFGVVFGFGVAMIFVSFMFLVLSEMMDKWGGRR